MIQIQESRIKNLVLFFLFFQVFNSFFVLDLEPKVLLRELDASSSEVEQIAQVDYGTFVSIDSQDFKRVVHELNAPSGDILFH